MRTVVPRLLASGYRLESNGPRAVVLRKTSRPGWTILVSVLFFPFGLLALSQTDDSQVVISIGRDGGETTVAFAGRAPLGVRRAAHALGRDHTS